MNNQPKEIFLQYNEGCDYKSAIGNKGLFEQSKINERFYLGDQWHGAKCGNERPLVRHNVIKRIGEYKIAQVLNQPIKISYSADGIPFEFAEEQEKPDFSKEAPDNNEINYVMKLFDKYHTATSERVKLAELNEKILKNAYVSGSSLLYTYWDSSVNTGLFADSNKQHRIKGDICCEVLHINDLVFGDPYCTELQKQPYIIISTMRDKESVLSQARLNGCDIQQLRDIEDSAEQGKVQVLTKLFKEYKKDGGYLIKGIKVTYNGVIRQEFDTGLHLYPLAMFCWERKNNSIYGESEITYLIPNQIAINRMITANVWATMTAGMPLMVVNGDTVTDKISNDPGQIIKVFGSNEDVSSAVNYVTPPSISKDFDASINTLITNTMTQSGANEVALGDSKADNATALATMRDAAILPLQIIKNRFYVFSEEVARIWADFWVVYYG